MKDLVALVADRDMEYALKGLLARPEALGMRGRTFGFTCNTTLAIGADIRVHRNTKGRCVSRQPVRPVSPRSAPVRP